MRYSHCQVWAGTEIGYPNAITHHPKLYNTTKIITNIVLIHVLVVIICNAYLKLGGSKLYSKASVSPWRNFLRTACFHHHLT